MFQTKVIDKIKTNKFISSYFFFFSKIAPLKIMWNNVVEPDRPQMTIWRMCIACWMSKATDTRSEYVILIALPLQQCLQKLASMLRHRYIACIVIHWCNYIVDISAFPRLVPNLPISMSHKYYHVILEFVKITT